MVHRGLAADAGIDLREQRGRHLHERHAAQEGGGGEAGEVADDAAAERDDRAAAIEARIDQAVVEERQPGQVLATPSGTSSTVASKPAPVRLFTRASR
jgi:hypothetical protein